MAPSDGRFQHPQLPKVLGYALAGTPFSPNDTRCAKPCVIRKKCFKSGASVFHGSSLAFLLAIRLPRRPI